MRLALCSSLLASLLSLASSLCSGSWGWDDTDTASCVYSCYSGTDTYTMSTLSYEQIIEACDLEFQVRSGGSCSSTQLVYPTDNCCPYCPCDAVDTAGSAHEFEYFKTQVCYKCTCTEYSPTATDLQFECTQFSYAYSYSWQDFECPTDLANYKYCVDPNDETDTYTSGRAWFSDVPADQDCTTFCYCPSGDTKAADCETSFTAIMGSTNDKLKTAFLDKCGDSIQGCEDTPSLMTTTDTGAICYECPSCACPDGKAEGDWWYASSSVGEASWFGRSEDTTACYHCTCDNGMSSCPDSEEWLNTHTSYKCPGSQSMTCHQAKSTTGDIGEKNSVLFATNAPEAWCAISLDTETGEEDEWEWGDGDLACSLYAKENECIKYTAAYTDRDCDEEDATVTTQSSYVWCCKGTDCNYESGVDKIVNADIDCREITEFSQMMSDMMECMNVNLYDDLICDLLTQQTTTCANVESYFKGIADCFCAGFKVIRDKATGSMRTYVESQIETAMTQFVAWAKALGCKGTAECDWNTGSVVFDGISGAVQKKMYCVLSIVLAAFLTLFVM